MSLLVNIEIMRELATMSSTLHAAVERAQLPANTRKRLLDLVDDLEPVTGDLKTSATHLSELINGLRELGKPRETAGKLLQTDPLPIVRHAIAVCQELVVTSRGSIAYAGPSKLPSVRISATELTQVLINIIANGAQAVAARGVPNGKVSVNARPEDGMLELQIRDDGVGMPPEVLNRAGTPFFTTRQEGTGLGLAQCQRLVGAAGGRFRIESEPGVGTTVTIVIPTAAAAAAA
jgi:signal transduction histidine kinase